MNQTWTPEQLDSLIADVRNDILQFSSGGNTLDRENILDLMSALDAVRADQDRLTYRLYELGLAMAERVAELGDQNDRLRAALVEIMAMSEPAGYGEKSKAQIRDVARRALGSDNCQHV